MSEAPPTGMYEPRPPQQLLTPITHPHPANHAPLAINGPMAAAPPRSYDDPVDLSSGKLMNGGVGGIKEELIQQRGKDERQHAAPDHRAYSGHNGIRVGIPAEQALGRFYSFLFKRNLFVHI